MKILSSFDTHLKHEYKIFFEERYGKDKVFIVSRDKLYFFIKVILRLIYGLTIHLGFMQLFYILGGYDILVYGFIAGLLFGTIFYWRSIDNYIDYLMNYAIFTPDDAMLIEQRGLFRRSIKTVDMQKIKSVSTRKSNIFFSIFNSGKLSILTEGDDQLGEISFKYVHNPEYAQGEIQKLMTLSR